MGVPALRRAGPSRFSVSRYHEGDEGKSSERALRGRDDSQGKGTSSAGTSRVRWCPSHPSRDGQGGASGGEDGVAT